MTNQKGTPMFENDFFIDTETTGTFTAPIVYDFGGDFVISENEFNDVIYEVFYLMPELMEQAHFSDKIPSYKEDIWESKRIVEEFFTLREKIRKMCYDGKIKRIFAHNASFDVRALNNTCKALSNGNIKYFFPYNVEICDTLKMARAILGKDEQYIEYCKKNNYMTNHAKPRPRMTAEIIYRYITNNENFEEAHTGLADVKIEKQIYEYLYSRNPEADPVLYHAKA